MCSCISRAHEKKPDGCVIFIDNLDSLDSVMYLLLVYIAYTLGFIAFSCGLHAPSLHAKCTLNYLLYLKLLDSLDTSVNGPLFSLDFILIRVLYVSTSRYTCSIL